MASEQVLKRAVFGGFRRENVIDYIEKLQIQLSESQKTADAAQRKCQILNKKADAFNDSKKIIDNLSSENTVLKAELDNSFHNTSGTFSDLSDINDIKSVIINAEESVKNAENLLNELSDASENKSNHQVSETIDSLLQVIYKISSLLDIDFTEDDNQFRFDFDGIEKVEEEYLNKMFIDE